MDTGVLALIVAVGTTILTGWFAYQNNRATNIKALTESVSRLTAELVTEQERRRAMQKSFAETVVRLETRIYEIEEKERLAQRKYTRALNVIKTLLKQLQREGLTPDATLDTGEL